MSYAANAESELFPEKPGFLTSWSELADNPDKVQVPYPYTDVFTAVAHLNAQTVRYGTAGVTKMVEMALFNPPSAGDGRHLQRFDTVDRWYRSLGSLNRLEGALFLLDGGSSLLNESGISVRGLEHRTRSLVLAGDMAREVALAYTFAPEGDRLRSMSTDRARSAYEAALTDPVSQGEKLALMETGKMRVPRSAEFSRLAQAKAALHDLEFDTFREKLFVAMGGCLMDIGMGQPSNSPLRNQRWQEEAWRLQRGAITDFRRFLDISMGTGKGKESPWPVEQAYTWFAELAIRNSLLAGVTPAGFPSKFLSSHIRMATRREDNPQDKLAVHRLPSLAFDLVATSYDVLCAVKEQVPLRLQTGHIPEGGSMPIIYETTVPSGVKVTEQLLKVGARQLIDELRVQRPTGMRPVTARRIGQTVADRTVGFAFAAA